MISAPATPEPDIILEEPQVVEEPQPPSPAPEGKFPLMKLLIADNVYY